MRSCCEGILDEEGQSALIDAAWSVTELDDARILMEVIGRRNERTALPLPSF